MTKIPLDMSELLHHICCASTLIGNMQSEEYKFGKLMFPICCVDVEHNLAIARKYIAKPVIDSILVEGKSMSQRVIAPSKYCGDL